MIAHNGAEGDVVCGDAQIENLNRLQRGAREMIGDDERLYNAYMMGLRGALLCVGDFYTTGEVPETFFGGVLLDMDRSAEVDELIDRYVTSYDLCGDSDTFSEEFHMEEKERRARR